MFDSVQGDETVGLRELSSGQVEGRRCSIEIPPLDVDRRAPVEQGPHPLEGVNYTSISMLVPRQRTTLKGRVSAVSLHLWPATSYKVQLNDGTGVVFLRFVGRRVLPGFEPGRWLSVEGTPAKISGQLVILNPLYSFLP
jgi:hypothetical protein